LNRKFSSVRAVIQAVQQEQDTMLYRQVLLAHFSDRSSSCLFDDALESVSVSLFDVARLHEESNAGKQTLLHVVVVSSALKKRVLLHSHCLIYRFDPFM
jgi:stress-induced morphogen